MQRSPKAMQCSGRRSRPARAHVRSSHAAFAAAITVWLHAGTRVVQHVVNVFALAKNNFARRIAYMHCSW
jgi:hypothetical protein